MHPCQKRFVAWKGLTAALTTLNDALTALNDAVTKYIDATDEYGEDLLGDVGMPGPCYECGAAVTLRRTTDDEYYVKCMQCGEQLTDAYTEAEEAWKHHQYNVWEVQEEKAMREPDADEEEPTE